MKLKGIIALGVMALGLNSCGDNLSNHKIAEYNGYDVIVSDFGRNTYLNIHEEPFVDNLESLDTRKYVRAIKNKGSKEFENIFLHNLSEEDALREYIHPDSLKKIYNYALETGRPIK